MGKESTPQSFKAIVVATVLIVLLLNMALLSPAPPVFAESASGEQTCPGLCCGGQGTTGCCQQGQLADIDAVPLSGEELNKAVARALSDHDVTQLIPTLTRKGYTAMFNTAGAAKITVKEDLNTTQTTSTEIILVSLPFKADEHVAGILSGTSNKGSYSYAITLDQKEDTWILTTYQVENGEIKEESSDLGGHHSCDYWCLLACAFQNPQILAECSAFIYCAFYWPPCVVPAVICIIALGAVAAICTIPCGCWEQPSATIKVESTPVHDSWSRHHGVSLDAPLNSNFWVSQPEKIIKTTGSAFTWEQTYSLSSGSHYFVYAPSSYWPDYYWNTKIYVNGQLVAQGDTGYNHQLTANFNV